MTQWEMKKGAFGRFCKFRLDSCFLQVPDNDVNRLVRLGSLRTGMDGKNGWDGTCRRRLLSMHNEIRK